MKPTKDDVLTFVCLVVVIVISIYIVKGVL